MSPPLASNPIFLFLIFCFWFRCGASGGSWQTTTLIGSRCKASNGFSQGVLITVSTIFVTL